MSTTNVALFLMIMFLTTTSVSSTNYKPTLPRKGRPSGGVHSLPAVVPGKQENNNNVKKCPKDTVKFGACGSWLGLVTEVIGTKPSEECCTLVKGLADFEAALCMCSAVKASLLGVVSVDTPVALSLLVNGCGKKIPEGFVCA